MMNCHSRFEDEVDEEKETFVRQENKINCLTSRFLLPVVCWNRWFSATRLAKACVRRGIIYMALDSRVELVVGGSGRMFGRVLE